MKNFLKRLFCRHEWVFLTNWVGVGYVPRGSKPRSSLWECAKCARLKTGPAEQRKPQHVCGLQGFGALGDVCPACEQRKPPAAGAVYVCPEKDIVCGRMPASWCQTCPLRAIRNAGEREA